MKKDLGEYPTEITNDRSKLASKLVRIRKNRDVLRQKSKTIKSKAKNLFGMEGGSKDLTLEADRLQLDAREKLRSYKDKVLLKKEAHLTQTYEKTLKAVEELNNTRYKKQFNYESTLGAVTQIVSNGPALITALQSEGRVNSTARALAKLIDLPYMRAQEHAGATPYYTEVSQFALSIIEDNLSYIKQHISQRNFSEQQELLNLVNKLVSYGSEEVKNLGLSAILKNQGVLRTALVKEERNYSWAATSSIELIFAFGSKEQVEETKQLILKVLKDNFSILNQTQMHYLVATLCDSQYPGVEESGETLLKQVLDKYGLNYKKARHAWLSEGSSPVDSMVGNLHTIADIESKQPGVAKFLQDKFGILDFRRYPTEMLISQYEEFENLNIPYGIVIYPRSDHNDALSSNRYMFQDLHDQLKGHYSLRVFECETKQDIARALITLQKKYNPNNYEEKRVAFAIVGGHGTPNTIQFGSGLEREVLLITDLMSKGVQRTGGYFKKDSTIILVSCSTGANKGIGQSLSEKLGIKVIAPEVPTNIKKITAEIGDQKIEFSVSYNNDQKKVFVAGQETIH